MLRVALEVRRGGFSLALELEATAGAPLVIVGESGAGKTTLLRLVAGLERPRTGRITFGDDVWLDGARVVPSWGRDVGYVAQDYALFPHLSVRENVAFGLRAQGLGARAARARGQEQLERLGIQSLADRLPAALSGGQQQRVALARALVTEPGVLLLDEPLAALDLRTRQRVRAELRELLRELACVTLYVTHQPADAFVMGDRVAVIEHGRLTQVGAREDLLRHPRSPYVAAFVGTNLFQGRVVERGSGVAHVDTGDAVLLVADPGDADQVFVSVNPRDITLYTEEPAASARNRFAGRIVELAPQPPDGERVRVVLDSHPPLVAEVTNSAVSALGLREGRAVYAGFKASGVSTYGPTAG